MILLSVLAAGAASLSHGPAPISLGRVFTAGEKLSYSVRSSLHSETRARGLQTWIPDDVDLNYDFNFEVLKLQADGIAVLHYRRPTMTQIDGESFDRGPVTKVEKVNFDLQFTVSPFNEILAMKDLKPKKPAKKAASMFAITPTSGRPQILQSIIGQFVGEVQRLALFVGSFESSLDFAPRTTFDDVSVGDTWKRTVGYQPQKLRGKDGKQAVQRLDFTYTYKGLVTTPKGKFHRVEGKLTFANDLADFVNQTFEVTSDQTGLKAVPLSMTSTITFDLDAKTRHTFAADAETTGDYKIILTDDPEDPAQEQKIKGRTHLRQLSRVVVPPGKKK